MSKNTLANGMFVREHTFKTGTKVINISIKAADFFQFMKDNVTEADKQGHKWLNLRLIPNKNVGDNKLSHTPILNNYTSNNADEAAQALAAEVLATEKAEANLPF